METIPFINEEFFCAKVSPAEIDELLETGWRHFGTYFYRYNYGFFEAEIRRVFVLRIRLSDFCFSKSQRRILRKNQDLETVIRPAEITPEKEDLFERHKFRFKDNTPNSIYDFLSPAPQDTPVEALEICIYRGEELLAVSFFDVGMRAVSSVYAMFAPEESRRGLGIFTLLLEIDWAKKHGKDLLYLGYAYEGNSFYDYKKRFRKLEKFDWNGNWEEFSGDTRE
jgi:leucyl-tRNA---protein transferase